MAAPSFRPISPNPFIVGNPVRDRSMFFGRQAEFQLVKKRFADSRHGGIMVFCGERRSGKTSILFQILDGRLGPGFLPVLIDMQSMAIENEDEFYRRVTSEIAAALGSRQGELEIPTYREKERAPLIFQDFVSSLIACFPDCRPIILVDEYELLETKIKSGALTPDVLHVFAGLLEKHPFFLVFTGSRHLEERTEGYWRILGQSIHRRISYLERSDAVDLIRRPVEGRVRYDEEAIELLLRLAAGQPFYTQALCQSLVDHLNDHRTDTVTREIVESVVNAIVNNPFPQMIFLWESLKRDEKLALALLAETLSDDEAFARPEDLLLVLREKKYPLDLSAARLSAALEELFQQELLIKHADVRQGVAYRMELWRHWILREHSVWQVMREENIRPRTRRRRALAGLAGVGGLGLLLLGLWLREGSLSRAPPAESGPAMAMLSLDPIPRNALVSMNKEAPAEGRFLQRIPADSTHTFTVIARDHADTTFTLRLGAGESESMELVLRPLRGGLRITTEPSGALVTVDGVPRGLSPVVVAGVVVSREHEVRAELAGYLPGSAALTVAAGDTSEHHVRLDPVTFAVAFNTTPSGASLTLDGEPKGSCPATLTGLRAGNHRVTASLAGYQPVDSLMTLSEATPVVHLGLAEEPPGVLTILGARLASRIYVDETRLVENVHNSGPCTLSTGIHWVQVVLPETTITRQVDVRPREHVVYDYVKDEIR